MQLLTAPLRVGASTILALLAGTINKVFWDNINNDDPINLEYSARVSVNFLLGWTCLLAAGALLWKKPRPPQWLLGCAGILGIEAFAIGWLVAEETGT